MQNQVSNSIDTALELGEALQANGDGDQISIQVDRGEGIAVFFAGFYVASRRTNTTNDTIEGDTSKKDEKYITIPGKSLEDGTNIRYKIISEDGIIKYETQEKAKGKKKGWIKKRSGKFLDKENLSASDNFNKQLENEGVTIFRHKKNKKAYISRDGVFYNHDGKKVPNLKAENLEFVGGYKKTKQEIMPAGVKRKVEHMVSRVVGIEGQETQTSSDITTKPKQPEREPEPEPEPQQPEPPKPRVVDTIPEISGRKVEANISNVSQHLEEIAMQKAQERLNAEREKKGIFKKALMFFTRKKRLDELYQEELTKLQGSMFHEETRRVRERASQRNTTERALQGNIAPKEDTYESNFINDIATQFVHGSIDEKEFITELEAYLSSEDNSQIIGGIHEQGSDILLELTRKRDVYTTLRGAIDGDDEKLEQLIRYSFHPENKEILAGIFGREIESGAIQDLIEQLRADEAMQKAIKSQKVEVSLSVYEQSNQSALSADYAQDRQNSGYRIGKWLQEYPITTFFAVPALNLALNFATSGVGKWISAGLGALGIGSITGLRRYAEYTDNHQRAQERVAQGDHQNHHKQIELLLTQQEQEKSWFKRQLIGLQIGKLETEKKWYGRTRKIDKPGITAQQGTMHHHFMHIEGLNRRFEKILAGEKLSQDDEKNKRIIISYLLQALARLDLQHDSGALFLRVNGEKAGEDKKGYREEQLALLNKNILNVAKALGLRIGTGTDEDEKNTLRTHETYINIRQKLIDDYYYAHGEFETTRRTVSSKVGLITGGIYAGTAGIIGHFSSGVETITHPGTPGTVTTSLIVDPNIEANLREVLGDRFDNFIINIQQANGLNTLWDTLVQDIYGSTSLGNDTKNSIMTFVLNATDTYNGGRELPSLLIQATHNGLMNDIGSGAGRIDEIIRLLNTWGYGSVDKTWLMSSIQDIYRNGEAALASYTQDQQVIIAEALWCYVHRTGINDIQPFKEVFMDTITTITGGTESSIETREKLGHFIGVPTIRNTFLAAIAEQAANDNKAINDSINDTMGKAQDKVNHEFALQTEALTRNIDPHNIQDPTLKEVFTKMDQKVKNSNETRKQLYDLYQQSERVGAHNALQALSIMSQLERNIFITEGDGGYATGYQAHIKDGGNIIIGGKVIDESRDDSYTKTMFHIAGCPETTNLQRALYHEIGHVITIGYAHSSDNNRHVLDLKEKVNQIGDGTGNWITAHAGKGYYRTEDKFWEDMAELMALYLVDRTYAASYLDDRIKVAREGKANIDDALKDEILAVLDNSYHWFIGLGTHKSQQALAA